MRSSLSLNIHHSAFIIHHFLSDSLRRAAVNQLLQKLDGEVNLPLGHVETRREREDVLVVAADIEHEAHAASARVEVALHSLGENPVGQLAVGFVPVLAANLDAQRHPAAVRVADDLRVAALQLAQLREEVSPFTPRQLFVVLLLHHAHGFEGDCRAECVRREGRVRRAGRELLRRDQFLARPHAGERVQAVRQRLAEDDDVRLDAEVLDGPEFPGAVEAHLNLVVNHQNLVLVQDFLERREVAFGRDDVAARPLNRLDVEGRELRFIRLRVPEGVVLGLEVALELLDAVHLARLLLLAVGAAEAVGEGDEVRAVGEVAEASAVAVARSYGRRAERAPVVAAHEGEDQILARRVAHDLEAVFNRLRAADIEVYAALQAELRLVQTRDGRRQLDLLRVQVLTRQLRQLVYLFFQRVIQTLIPVAETGRRVPHLQVEVRRAFAVVEVVALAAVEELWRVEVVNRVAPRTILSFQLQQLLLVGDARQRHGRGDVCAHLFRPMFRTAG